MNLLSLGGRLKYLRNSASLSRIYIEKHYGIPESTITRWESTAPVDIGINKLIRYLDIYKKRGFQVTLDNLLIDKEFVLNSHSTNVINNFLDTSFCLSLLKGATSVFFYADRTGRLLYINPRYQDFLQLPPNTFSLKINDLRIEEVLLVLKKKKLSDVMTKILNGSPADIEYQTTQEGHLVKVRFLPNFCTNNLVIGFASLIVGTSMTVNN